ncbi:hypothetical protein CsSME_00029647 [Camellia sinensis var. sinensis]
MPCIYGLQQGRDGGDSVVWDVRQSKGVFSVSSFYGAFAGDAIGVFPWKCIWALGSPTKVAFFVWTAILGRILTIDNLIRRQHVLVDWCCMCCRDAKTVDHLLLHCSIASRLWGFIVALFGLVWVQSASVLGVLQSWGGARVGKRHWKAWVFSSHCLLWLVWSERNRRVFQDKCHSVSWLESRLLMVLHSWVKGTVDPNVLVFVDFVEDLIS